MLSQLLADPVLIFGGVGMILFLIVALLLSVFWVWMLIDAVTNTALEGAEKIVWVLVILFTHFLGAVIYFLVGRGSRSRPVL